jgi:hypothetical protein
MADAPDREPADRRAGEPSRAPAAVRIADGGRGPFLLAALILVFIVGAVLKPWAPPARQQGLIQGATPQPTQVAPSIEPDALAGLRAQCEEPEGWRVYSRGGFLDLAVRVWRSVVPATAAAGPLDPAMPLIQVGVVNEAVGYCAPWTGAERPPDLSLVSAWRLARDAGGSLAAVAVPLVRVAPDRASVLGALYAGPADGSSPADGTATRWPLGRYVFAVRSPAWERWWAVDISTPSTAPGSAPGPVGSRPPSPDPSLPAERPASP